MQDFISSLESMGVITAIAIGITAAIVYIIKTYKSTVTQVDMDTIKSQKENIEALEKRISIIESENKELHAQVNQLIGENKALKETLAMREPEVMRQISEGFKSMKEVLSCLKNHDLQAKEIKEDTTKILADLDYIHQFCDENVKPVLDRKK